MFQIAPHVWLGAHSRGSGSQTLTAGAGIQVLGLLLGPGEVGGQLLQVSSALVTL